MHAEATASGEQLLRRADQAMYQVKAHKRQRARWWSLPPQDGSAELPDEHDDRDLPPYGELAAELLGSCIKVLESRMPTVIEQFHAELLTHAGVAKLLGVIPADGMDVIKRRQSRYLLALLRPDLDLASQRAKAIQSGFFYAACGVEEVWLLEAVERLRDLLAVALGAGVHRDQRPLNIVLQRLALEIGRAHV